jgi:hypothetical protein
MKHLLHITIKAVIRLAILPPVVHKDNILLVVHENKYIFCFHKNSTILKFTSSRLHMWVVHEYNYTTYLDIHSAVIHILLDADHQK